VIGYSGDDINKFLWMVRIAEGEHPKDIRVWQSILYVFWMWLDLLVALFDKNKNMKLAGVVVDFKS
jgi:hypothetical protein